MISSRAAHSKRRDVPTLPIRSIQTLANPRDRPENTKEIGPNPILGEQPKTAISRLQGFVKKRPSDIVSLYGAPFSRVVVGVMVRVSEVGKAG